jgi:hypothetical protein
MIFRLKQQLYAVIFYVAATTVDFDVLQLVPLLFLM